jgi:hypothetical protein
VSMVAVSEADPLVKGVVWLGSVPTSEHVGPLVLKLTFPWSCRESVGPRARAGPAGSQARAEARAPQAVMAAIRRGRLVDGMTLSPR